MKKCLLTFAFLLALLLPVATPARASGLRCPVGAVWCQGKHYRPFVCLDKHGHQHRHFDPKKYHCILF